MSDLLAGVRFVRVGASVPASPQGVHVWDVYGEDGIAFARAEVFPGSEQWGVRVQDRVPALADADLLKLVAHLLVWHAACPAETVDVVLGRTHEHHTLVRVGGEYV